MLAALDAEQQQLVAMARQMAAAFGSPAPAELPSVTDDRGQWATLVETGLIAMHLDESAGGGGARSADVALVVEQLAGPPCLVPFLGQGVLAPELARLARAEPEFLRSIATGARRVTIGLSAELRSVATIDRPAIAFDARGADSVLVTDGERLLAVPLTSEVVEQVDITRILSQVPIDPMGAEVLGHLTPDSLRRFEAFALAMLAADLVGIASSALGAACGYVSDRRQFGVAVGTFQAVQHLAADAAVSLEAARSSMWHAAWAADELTVDAALLAARQAKAVASRAVIEVVEIQTQLFGGIALTWEERAHVRVRRALLDRVVLGDEYVQYDAIAAARLGDRA